MNKVNIFSVFALAGTVLMAGCKTNQPMFAGTVYSAYILGAIFVVLLVWVMRKFL